MLTVRPLARLPLADPDRMLAVNLRGPLLVTRTVLPVMLRQQAGVIVNVASQLGKQGLGDYVTSCATKFGLVGMTQALAATNWRAQASACGRCARGSPTRRPPGGPG